jgi:hypothetical protein
MAKKAANYPRPRRKSTKAKPKTIGKKRGKSASSQYKWLFMVYMQAGDNSNLDSLAVQDLVELQEGVQGSKDSKGKPDGRVSGNPNVVVLVQMQRKWPDLAQLYFIGPGESVENRGQATYKDVATKDSLVAFLARGREVGLLNDVTHYCLVLWGHNFGLGFGRDHDDALTLKELAAALAEARDKQFGGERLQLLATNSCTMAYIEAAFELRESAEYLVASQVFMPPKGFPYSSIIRSIDTDTTPRQLGEIFVEEYVSSFANSPDSEKVALSLLRLDGAAQFKQLLQDAASTIRTLISQGRPTVVQEKLREMQDVFLANLAGDTRPVLDLQSLAANLVTYCEDLLKDSSPSGKSKSAGPLESALTSLKETGEKLGLELSTEETRPQPEGKAASATPALVLKNSANPDFGLIGGVGVFAPFVVDTAMRTLLELESDTARKQYEDLAIFKGTERSWPSLVYDTLRRDEPDEIVNASGVVQRADRKLVNQMVGAVDAAFNILDRVMKSSKPTLVTLLGEKATDSNQKNGAPFGLPRLRLLGDLALQTAGKDRRPARVSQKIVSEFQRIERAVGLVETTIKSVMTNGSFGLGPPFKVGFGPDVKAQNFGPDVKAQNFGPDVKAQNFGPDVKAQNFGPDVKAQNFGQDDLSSKLGALSAFLSSDAQIAMLSVTVMFRAIVNSLGNLEQAVANIELAAAESQLQRDFGSVLDNGEFQDAMSQRLDRLFSIAAEGALQARRTAREIMGHPVYGLGSGPDGFGQSERNELAISAGLSRRQLALL